MKTKIIAITGRVPLKKIREKLLPAARIISRGGIVAFPTETVYGLGANALDSNAVKKIFKAKERPADDPLIVHVANLPQVREVAEHVPKKARLLMEKHWPGPLTIVLKKSRAVPKITTGGLDTVAVRVPANRVALELIRTAGVPIAAPSANLFGRPSPTSAKDVLEDLDGKTDAVIDGGRTKIGIESTIVDLSGKTPVLLRPGKITLGQLRKTLGKISVHPLVDKKSGKGKRKSPGMSRTHYAPRAEVILVEGNPKKSSALVKELFSAMKVKAAVISLGGKDRERTARSLYSKFREMDRKGIKTIIVKGVEVSGMGHALMNRARRAARKIIRV